MISPLPDPAPALPPPRHAGRGDGLFDFAEKIRSIVVTESVSILDVGAGDAWLLDFVPRTWSYFSVDLNPFGAEVIADAHALPYRDRAFDVVVSKQTLPHFNSPHRVCREMLRVARRLVIIRQEFPEPVGWLGHSRVRIDSPNDVIDILAIAGPVTYDGVDFVVRKDPRGEDEGIFRRAQEV